jgi:dTDP-4-amino-4,6-dideoxygalactose transaminase
VNSRTPRAGWLTTGPNVAAFEQAFARACGVPHAVALNSCTAALHVALRAFDVGPGDEVVMPSLTFVAGAQCAMELGATPVFADIDPDALSATAETIEPVLTARTKVIIAMPYAGRPLDIEAIVRIARPRGIKVLEDAAHAAGMLAAGRWAGAVSDAAAYSFYATKNMTTCEGGMLVTSDGELADRARSLGLHGMDRDAWKRYTAKGTWRYDVREPGFKYNLPDPMAAIGLGQLARLDEMQQRRDEIAQAYGKAFESVDGIAMQAPPNRPGDRHSWCMFAILVDEKRLGISRDDLIEELRDEKIGTSVHYIPTHLFSAYRDLATGPLPQTDRIWQQLISLPLYPAMTDDDVADVVEAVRTASARGARSVRVPA